MKIFKILLLTIIWVAMIPINPFYAEEDSNWNQYRYKSDKNAVIKNSEIEVFEGSIETANEVRATPVVVGDKLFVGNHDTGELFAFDIETGDKIWESKAPNWIHSEMIHNDGRVYVGFGNRFFQETEERYRGTGESGVLALDAETGEELWRYNTDGEVMPTPVYYDGAVYATTGDRHLYKFDANSGELLHKEELGSTISMSAPNLYNDKIYVGGSGPVPYTFYAYNLQNDEIVWYQEFDEVVAGLDDVPPAIVDDVVVTTAIEGSYENPNHMIYAMDSESGEILWQSSLGEGEMVKNNKSGAPMIYKDTIFVGSPITKTFYAYDLRTGEKKWEFEDTVMKAPPVAKGGIVYFTNTNGEVIALNAESGEEVGRKELGGVLAPSGPIIVNDQLIVGSQDHNVYLVHLDGIVDEEIRLENEQEIDENDEESNFSNSWILLSIVIIILIVITLWMRKRTK